MIFKKGVNKALVFSYPLYVKDVYTLIEKGNKLITIRDIPLNLCLKEKIQPNTDIMSILPCKTVIPLSVHHLIKTNT